MKTLFVSANCHSAAVLISFEFKMWCRFCGHRFWRLISQTQIEIRRSLCSNFIRMWAVHFSPVTEDVQSIAAAVASCSSCYSCLCQTTTEECFHGTSSSSLWGDGHRLQTRRIANWRDISQWVFVYCHIQNRILYGSLFMVGPPTPSTFGSIRKPFSRRYLVT